MSVAMKREARSTKALPDCQQIAIFQTKLGWVALATWQESLVRLVFGYESAGAARDGLKLALGCSLPRGTNDSASAWLESLKSRLVEFGEGQADDFLDVAVWSEDWTPFQRQVLNRCRQIPYGQTRTYAELAFSAGKAGAARAVGRTMATNPVPLVVPCHRVVGSAGDLRGFSAVGGLDVKRRLLDLEHELPLAPHRGRGNGAIAGKISHAVRKRAAASATTKPVAKAAST